MPPKEITIISGKGGTGKTSLTASFATLAHNAVLADCDVDAADLHLALSPRIHARHEFHAGNEAVIDPDYCSGCGVCFARCRFDAIRWRVRDGHASYCAVPFSCEGCGVCVDACPPKAIGFPERLAGEWFESETAYGPMVHARLGAAAENSGKLVGIVRQRARAIAEERHLGAILADGPPGIGCPVIASVTGASLALIVTEPTLSGRHDLERVAELTRHFHIPAAVCVNKWDLNPEMSAAIEARARELDARPIGRLRYDPAVTQAQVAGKTVLEWTGPNACGIAEDIAAIWKTLASIVQIAAVA